MDKELIKWGRWDGKILKGLRYATFGLFLAMTLLVMMGIFFRYVISSPPFWSEELARYFMFYLILVGSSVAVREEKHPSLTFIIQKFSPRFQKIWSRLLDILVFLVLIFVFWEGLLMAIDEWIMKTPSSRIPFSCVYAALPLGAILMMFQLVVKNVFGKASSLEEQGAI
jgi:TRAP-type C4-dicarboxylate transport system permease small subunit